MTDEDKRVIIVDEFPAVLFTALGQLLALGLFSAKHFFSFILFTN